MSLEQTHYDVAILSTALPQATLSAALSSAGLSVIHLDQNDYYADTWASLTLSELQHWADRPQAGISQVALAYPAYTPPNSSSSSSHTVPEELFHLDRHYALSLAPTLLPATGPSIDALIASNVSSYATFRLLEHTAVYTPANAGLSRLARVPSSKEDIFKTKSLSLIAKRKLMKLLLHIASDDWDADLKADPALAARPFVEYLEKQHKFSPDLVSAVAYGVSLCTSPLDATGDALQRARSHLKSIGRYGNSAYLVGQYGGAGELAQGYCRASAVKGGMFILDHKIASLARIDVPLENVESSGPSLSKRAWQIQVTGLEQKITADVVVSSDEILQGLLPTDVSTTAEGDDGASGRSLSETMRGILVLDRQIDFEAGTRESRQQGAAEGEAHEGPKAESLPTPPETGLLVLPPSSIGEGAERNESTVMVLMMGEGTFSCPKGQYVYYIQTQSSGTSTSSTPKELLRPTVDLILDLASHTRFDPSLAAEGKTSDGTAIKPLLQFFYRQTPPPSPRTLQVEGADLPPLAIVFPSDASITSLTDQAVKTAETTYYEVLARLHQGRHGGSMYDARARVEQSMERKKAKKGRKRRDPAEYQGRGGRGEDDGVTATREADQVEAEDVEDDSVDVVGFFEKREDDRVGRGDDDDDDE